MKPVRKAVESMNNIHLLAGGVRKEDGIDSIHHSYTNSNIKKPDPMRHRGDLFPIIPISGIPKTFLRFYIFLYFILFNYIFGKKSANYYETILNILISLFVFEVKDL